MVLLYGHNELATPLFGWHVARPVRVPGGQWLGQAALFTHT